MTRITSRDNSLLRRARAVRDGKIDELIFVEGLRLCEEALRSGLVIGAVIYSEEIAKKERAARFLEEVSTFTTTLALTSENLLTSVSYTKTPQGIIVLAQRPDSGRSKLETNDDRIPLLVLLHGINNPVNVGIILRSAEAAGATGIVTTMKTADPFSPKALRGAMGSTFRLPIWKDADYADALAWCATKNIKTICAYIAGTALHTDVDWRIPRALILGPESTGLSPEDIALAKEAVRIAMQGRVESLNVGVAAAILLYEAARQRKIGTIRSTLG